MTPEEKHLLFIDLCARLPYITYYDLSYYGHKTRAVLQELITTKDPLKSLVKVNTVVEPIPYENIKPYLRPMSSMTEDEKKEFETLGWRVDELDDNVPWNHNAYNVFEGVDWLNKKMFDYRGLIPMGLALVAKEGMYKTE